MRRRKFVSAVALAALAGCADQPDEPNIDVSGETADENLSQKSEYGYTTSENDDSSEDTDSQ